jgi:hypothetical protein
MTSRSSWFFALSLGLLAVVPAHAQDRGFQRDTMPVPDSIVKEAPVPRAAFVRAMLLPGWGHLYLGETRRAGVYFALETSSYFMLAKTMSRLGDVKERRDRLVDAGTDSLNTAMAQDTALARKLADPEAFEAALAAYPGLQHERSLTRAREQQRQDWITYTLFFTFVSAVDAYVTAHLKDFPGDIMTTIPTDGGLSLGVRMPVGNIGRSR